MTSHVDRIYFEELAAAEPSDVCRRALCRYDEGNHCYMLPIWGDEYAVCPHGFSVRRLNHQMGCAHAYLDLLIVHYLLHARAIDVINKWISEKEIPGGTTFF